MLQKPRTYESIHYNTERKRRIKTIMKIGGKGKILDTFLVDRKHRCGLELHALTSNGIIIIYNAKTRTMITNLIARPAQIKRYYNSVGKTPPSELMCLAYEHWKAGLYHHS